jgi:hypothetical protein
VQGNKKNNAMQTKEKANGLFISVNGLIQKKQFSNEKINLKEMQDCVGGRIEFVYLPENKILVVNEEGKLNDLPLNGLATMKFWDNIRDMIVGNVLLIDQKYID